MSCGHQPPPGANAAVPRPCRISPRKARSGPYAKTSKQGRQPWRVCRCSLSTPVVYCTGMSIARETAPSCRRTRHAARAKALRFQRWFRGFASGKHHGAPRGSSRVIPRENLSKPHSVAVPESIIPSADTSGSSSPSASLFQMLASHAVRLPGEFSVGAVAPSAAGP